MTSVGMKLVLIPAGEFMMGSPDFRLLGIPALDDQMPQHRVFITKPFYLGVYPVTQAEYHRVTGTNPSHFNGESHGGFKEVWKMLCATGPAQGPFKGQPSHPVESITWDMANAFCRQLSSLPQEASAGNVYRLPTEAEWEYACRAGTTRRFFGDDDGSDDDGSLEDYAWLEVEREAPESLPPHFVPTNPVGRRKANRWGCTIFTGMSASGVLTGLMKATTLGHHYLIRPGPDRGVDRVYRGDIQPPGGISTSRQ